MLRCHRGRTGLEWRSSFLVVRKKNKGVKVHRKDVYSLRTRRHGGWEGAQKTRGSRCVHWADVWINVWFLDQTLWAIRVKPFLQLRQVTQTHPISLKTKDGECVYKTQQQSSARTTSKHNTSECTPLYTLKPFYIFNRHMSVDCLDLSLQTEYWFMNVSRYSLLRLGWSIENGLETTEAEIALLHTSLVLQSLFYHCTEKFKQTTGKKKKKKCSKSCLKIVCPQPSILVGDHPTQFLKYISFTVNACMHYWFPKQFPKPTGL